MAGSFAKGTAIGGLPVPIAVIALPQPADPCFSDLARRREAGEAGRVRGSEPQQ